MFFILAIIIIIIKFVLLNSRFFFEMLKQRSVTNQRECEKINKKALTFFMTMG